MLQGLVLCGRCGLRMTVRYATRNGRNVANYLCQRRGIQTAEPACQVIPGTGLDEAVGQLVLEAVTPASLEVVLEVFEELRARSAEIDRQRRAQVERARQDAELAQRQFLLVRPEHRLVADNLERQWNEKLALLAQAEQQYDRAAKSGVSDLSARSKDRILALASDLPGVWNDPRTPARERKRMLRLLVEDVTLVRDRAIKLHIRWKGGATTSCERPLPLNAADLRRTPADIVEQVRALATELTDRQIAQTLNARWLRSGTGKPFTPALVRFVRTTYDIDSLAQNLRRAGWLTCEVIASELHVHPCTAKRFASEGVLRAVRADDKGLVLFEPPTGPLPRAHPGKRFKDRRRYPQLAAHVRKEMQYEA